MESIRVMLIGLRQEILVQHQALPLVIGPTDLGEHHDSIDVPAIWRVLMDVRYTHARIDTRQFTTIPLLIPKNMYAFDAI